MHTKDMLARAMREAGLMLMAKAAEEGLYHDYLSPLEFPNDQLREELTIIGSRASLALLERVEKGEFDATPEESDAWAKGAAGQAAMRRITG